MVEAVEEGQRCSRPDMEEADLRLLPSVRPHAGERGRTRMGTAGVPSLQLVVAGEARRRDLAPGS